MSTREAVLDVLRANPGATRAQVIELTGLSGSRTNPASMRLWLAGEIEPDSERGWNEALARTFELVGWRVVEDHDRKPEVAKRAASRTKRNRKPSAEEQARVIVEQLDDPIVQRLVAELTKDGRGSVRAQRRAEQAMRKLHTERRQEARKAAREKSADAEFRALLKGLWEARGSVAAIDKYLIEERARYAGGQARKIGDREWLMALVDVRMIIKSFGSMWQNVRELGEADEPCPACGAAQAGESLHLRPFAIEGEAVEEETLADDHVVVDARVVP